MLWGFWRVFFYISRLLPDQISELRSAFCYLDGKQEMRAVELLLSFQS